MGNKGTFEKNHVKVGGRVKGTPNKSSQAAKDWIREFLEGDREQANDDWVQLMPKERWDVRTKMLRFVAPQMSSIDFVDVSPERNTVREKLKELVKDDNIV